MHAWDTTWNEGKCKHAKQRGTALITEPYSGKRHGKVPDQKSGYGGEEQRDDKPDIEITFGTGRIFTPHFHGDKTGDGSLDSGACDGKAKRSHRCKQLINTKTFCTNQAG